MNSSIDLNLLLLARQDGNITSELPDLYAVTPPRRAAHGRETDSLIIYLSMTGNSPLAPEAHAQLLEQVAHKFYKTSGSLTSALRTIVESINSYLLDRNLRSTSLGRQGIGQLVLLALRNDTVYMAHCGGVHAFSITPDETKHIYDPQSSGRGLGLSRTTPIRYLQTQLGADDYLVLATIASPKWPELPLIHPKQQGIEALGRQLLENAEQEFNSVIIQAQTGTGKLRLLKPKTNIVDAAYPVAADQIATTTAPAPGVTEVESPAEDHRLGIPSDEQLPVEMVEQPVEDKGLGVSSASIAQPEVENGSVEDRGLGVSSYRQPSTISAGEDSRLADEPFEQPSPPSPTDTQPPATFSVDSSHQEAQPSAANQAELQPERLSPTARPQRVASEPRPSPIKKYLVSFRATLAPVGSTILGALKSAMGTVGSALLRLLKNLLPDADVMRMPPSTMLFIAIAIPLILAVIGGMVFLQRGRAQQHQIFYQQAVEQAAYATTLTDPMEQRLAWQAVLADLDKAEYYTLTSQSQDLRTQATSKLDALDAVKRLDYQQAIVGGLDSGINVTRLVATTTDLYLLNGNQGNVLRAIMTGRGYEIDPDFQCGPTYGPINVGPLVDIAELPPGSFEDASLLGMDSDGNLLYCVVGSQPYSAALAPPNTGFGEPSALSLDRGDLYLLDPKVNAVWIYRNMEVTQQPRLFFGDMVPPMQDVIDLAVYNDDLFLLHADGHTTKCTFSGMVESPTRCDDPYPYSDNRPGRVHGPIIQDAVFNQVYFSSFPERSIYMLSPQNQSIYYFSVLLTLQWQYQSNSSLPQGNATAFAISPNRMAFLAIGNYVYYAALP